MDLRDVEDRINDLIVALDRIAEGVERIATAAESAAEGSEDAGAV